MTLSADCFGVTASDFSPLVHLYRSHQHYFQQQSSDKSTVRRLLSTKQQTDNYIGERSGAVSC